MMAEIPNELAAVMLAEAFAIIALVWKMDKRLAVMETELRFMRVAMGMGISKEADS